MVAFSTIKVGDRLFQKVRQKMGNTTARRDAIYTVVVTEVHEDHVMASWNGNPPRRWLPREVGKLRRTEPKREPDIFERAFAARRALAAPVDPS